MKFRNEEGKRLCQNSEPILEDSECSSMNLKWMESSAFPYSNEVTRNVIVSATSSWLSLDRMELIIWGFTSKKVRILVSDTAALFLVQWKTNPFVAAFAHVSYHLAVILRFLCLLLSLEEQQTGLGLFVIVDLLAVFLNWSQHPNNEACYSFWTWAW